MKLYQSYGMFRHLYKNGVTYKLYNCFIINIQLNILRKRSADHILEILGVFILSLILL